MVLLLLFLFAGVAVLAVGQNIHQKKEAEREAAAEPLLQPPTPEAIGFAQRTLNSADSACTFREAVAWLSTATEARARLLDFIDAVSNYARDVESAVAQASDDQRYAVRRTRKLVERAQEEALEAASLLEELTERSSQTPTDSESQKEVIRILRQEKQMIAIAKREARAEAAEVRRRARSASVAAEPLFRYRGSSRVTANRRRAIRERKEEELRPIEDTIEALTQQDLLLDRRIAWARSLRKD